MYFFQYLELCFRLQVIVTGWNLTDSRSHYLLQARLPLVTQERCQEAYGNSTGYQISYKQLCAGGQNNVNFCVGDNGGPQQTPGIYGNKVVRIIQHGIISYGLTHCGIGDVPIVSTRVAYYTDWILNTMTD